MSYGPLIDCIARALWEEFASIFGKVLRMTPDTPEGTIGLCSDKLLKLELEKFHTLIKTTLNGLRNGKTERGAVKDRKALRRTEKREGERDPDFEMMLK